MKRLLVLCLLFLSVCGCSAQNGKMDQALALRQRLLAGNGCSFSARITADYQESLYEFTLVCRQDAEGTVYFEVDQPESIRGIAGNIDHRGGKLTFDDKVLAFPLLADGLFSPVSAPWLFLQSLQNGYIKSCGIDGDVLTMTIHDTYDNQSIQTEIFADANGAIMQADIFWQGRRILSMIIRDFVYL